MKIECHIIQNFPPHCLNRDDTNSPKDCEFGGVRRARISSQCFKRAVRDAFERHHAVSPETRAVRTKRIVDEVVGLLVAKGKASGDATKAVLALLEQVKLKTEPTEEGSERTQYLLFLPARKLGELATLAEEHWDALMTAVAASDSSAVDAAEADTTAEKPKAKSKGSAKAKGKSKDGLELPKEARAAVQSLLRDARQTPEIALFGRMIADNPDWNIEAACQVAHAISTHRVSMEFDFFTAVDDLKKNSESGSDMMGTVQFNSACFYRYAVVDCDGLELNLGGEGQRELAAASTEAFLQAFVHARPTGKQNSMAAHTLPSFVLVVVRKAGEPLSLANAFVKPVTVKDSEDDLQVKSVRELSRHFAQLKTMYPDGIEAVYACAMEGLTTPEAATTTQSVADLIKKVRQHVDAAARAA